VRHVPHPVRRAPQVRVRDGLRPGGPQGLPAPPVRGLPPVAAPAGGQGQPPRPEVEERLAAGPPGGGAARLGRLGGPIHATVRAACPRVRDDPHLRSVPASTRDHPMTAPSDTVEPERLVRYLRELAQLRTRPILRVDDYEFVTWFA